MNRRHFLHLGAACGAMAALPALAQGSAAGLTKLRFTLDFRISGQTAPFLLALYKGYYREEGLDVSLDVGSGSVASITRVASGVYDMGFGDVSSLIEFNAQQAPAAPPVLAVYQYYNRAPFAIIGRKDRGITNDFASLQGKRIAAAAVESTKRCWPMAARHAGLKPDALQWVTTDFSARDNVLVRGDVDGATYFHDSAVSLFQRMKPEELSVLSYAGTGLALYGNAVLASTKFSAENPKAVAGFVRATNRALLETIANPVAAMPFVKQREPILDEKVELERWRITQSYVIGPDAKDHGLGDVRKAFAEAQLAEVVETFGLKARPKLDAVYDLSFLPPREQRLPRAA
ncbi:ABC transporter substrate-binding protein [Azohydromonas aeria]|uniref:ABC transporter substrate-binding protein n=1 Tax=Azohydromonas aeria TaxID=2590212 RepID=UPI0012F7E6E0|nr:ABC transporter substrate-binding protein [Azohydromonas aeria]